MKICRRSLSVLLSMLLVCGMIVCGSATAAFAADGAAETTVRVTNSENEVTVAYKQTQYYEFEAENLPYGAAVHVYLNGEDRGESTYIYVTKPTEDYTVEAKVLDRDGNELASSGEIKAAVRNGFFDRVFAAVRSGLRTAADAVMDILSAIFMTIYVFIKRL